MGFDLVQPERGVVVVGIEGMGKRWWACALRLAMHT